MGFAPAFMYSSVIIFITYFLEILKETYNNHIQEKVQIYQAGTRGKRGEENRATWEGEWERENGRRRMERVE